MPNGMTLHVDEAAAEYKRLTGVDLTEYGLANIAVN